MKYLLLVFLGGGLGSVIRYVLALWIQPNPAMFIPYQTLIANLAACLILGMTAGFLQYQKGVDPSVILLITTGFCGGLSTFSTFIGDSYQLIDSAKNYWRAFSNIFVNLVGCFVFYIGGHRLAGLIN